MESKNRGLALIETGLILAAGHGKRMGYLSEILPKPLFPIYDKPVIHYILEKMQGIGVKQVYVVVNYQKEKIIEYMMKIKEVLKVNIRFIYQKELLGIAHAISLAETCINEPFITMLGDDFTITDSISNLVDAFFEKNAVVVEGVVEEEDKKVLKRTCCVKLGKDNKIIEIIEKPQIFTSNLRGTGAYIFSEKIFEYIKRTPISNIRNEKEISHTIGLVARDGKAYGEFINGVNININTNADLFTAWCIAKDAYTEIEPLVLSV